MPTLSTLAAMTSTVDVKTLAMNVTSAFTKALTSTTTGRSTTARISDVTTRLLENVTSYINVTPVTEEICTHPAFHEFPPDAFTTSQRAHGAIVFHVILVIYMFVALSIVCDDYFVASLDKVCDRLGFSEDVAGATFMAAGSSMPELFTAIIGVFITKGDVGIGTIVGSAVFNILFVIGMCGLLVKETMSLSWWPLCRDSVYYSLAIVVLILVVGDGEVTWYESVIMLIMYGFYILIMRYNRPLQSICTEKLKWLTSEKLSSNGFIGKQLNKFQGDYQQFGDDDDVFGATVDHTTNNASNNASNHTVNNVNSSSNDVNNASSDQKENDVAAASPDHYALKCNIRLSFEEGALRIMMSRHFRGRCRFRAAARLVVSYRRRMMQDTAYLRRQMYKTVNRASTMRSYAKSVRNWMTMSFDGANYDSWKEVPNYRQDGYLVLFKWVAVYPIKAVLYYTIPDCRRPRWERFFLVTFLASIVWIAIFSYITVWMVTYIGFAFGIPDSVMGITFLAAGTSVPDAMASIFVAKQGMADMAVSNCVGSNIFDILLGLSFPWFLKTAIIDPGSIAYINSGGMVFNIVLLFLTVIITVGAVHMAGWILNKCVGITCMLVYAVYLVFAIMIECNSFGYVNPPMCKE